MIPLLDTPGEGLKEAAQAAMGLARITAMRAVDGVIVDIDPRELDALIAVVGRNLKQATNRMEQEETSWMMSIGKSSQAGHAQADDADGHLS